MAFTPKTGAWSGKIQTVTLGTGENSITLGGQSVLPFYSFDGPIPNRPKIGLEVSGPASCRDVPGLAEFYAGCESMADCARRAEAQESCDFIALNFESADPNGMNRSVEDCVADARAVAQAVSKPLVILGCKNMEKDSRLLAAIAEALQGRNVLFLSARSEDYKAIGAAVALAYGQKVGAETADDINLAKQLNIMLKQLTVKPEQIVMNIGTAAVGYGFEYVASTLDRVRLAAMQQGDEDLQMPIIAPVFADTWSVKESTASVEDEPDWGPREDRAVQMEISTAAANLTGGADAVILRHPRSAEAVRRFIDGLM